MPRHAVGTAQSQAYDAAVLAELGIPADAPIKINGSEASGDHGVVHLTAFIPAARLVELFNNAGRTTAGTE